MRIGGSLLLIAAGAILAFAVTKQVSGIDLQVVGVILMVIGGAGLLISLIMASTRRRTDVIQRSAPIGYDRSGRAVAGGTRTTYVEPRNDDLI
jgi:hypothetical protein